MARRETDAFVLQTYTLGEADKICVLFTERYGKVRGVARGARRTRSRFGASLEPLSEVHVEYYEREGRELVTIGNSDLLRSLFGEESDPEGQAIIHYIVELVDRFAPPHEANKHLYRLIGAIAKCFGIPRRRWPLLTLYFDVWMMKLGGFFPHLDHCVKCDRPVHPDEPLVLATDGRPECTGCQSGGGGFILAPLVRQEIDTILRESPAQWLAQERNIAVIRMFAQYLRGQIRRVLETEVRAERFLNR